MNPARVIDQVCSVLTEAQGPLRAQQLTEYLAPRGIRITRPALNQILYAPENQRDGLTHDREFRWTYSPTPLPREEPSEESPWSEAVRSLLRSLDVETLVFEGTRRAGTMFFFIEEVDDQFVVVGPAGNLLKDRSELFEPPDVVSLDVFTVPQVIKALMELVDRKQENVVQARSEVLDQAEQTELLDGVAYQGAPIERVQDNIPVDAMIVTAVLTPHGRCAVGLGPGSILCPVYLVVDATFPFDRRVGVYRASVYDLLKDGFVSRQGPDLTLNLVAPQEGDVYIEGPKGRRRLP